MIKSFHPYSRRSSAKLEVRRLGWQKSLMSTFYRPTNVEDPGHFIPGKSGFFGSTHH